MQQDQDQQPQPSYDFILNSGQPQKRSPLPVGSPDSTFKRALIAGGFAIVIIVIAIVGMSLLKSGGKETRQALLSVVQAQQETARIADSAATESSSQAVKNVAITTALGLSSSQQELVAVIGKHGISFKEKELLVLSSDKTDAALESAKAAGTYDTTVLQTVKDDMSVYTSALATSFKLVKNEEIKQSIQKQYSSAVLITKQLEATTP